MTEHRDDDRFAARIAEPLREPEGLDQEFERRVMTAVRATRTVWWRRGVTVTPVRGFAMAASFAGLVVLGTLGATGWFDRAPAVAVVAADTVHLVRFVLVAPDAEEVALVGDFNGWSRGTTTLVQTGEAGVWSVSLPLEAGRHEYAFVVDGERWIPDPMATRHVDEFGTESSILRVGSDNLRGV